LNVANDPADLSGVKALTFDVFGTVVDWRGSIISYGAELDSELDASVDWPMFADAWRAAYRPGMDRVRRGDLPWTNLDDLHRMSLDRLAPAFGLGGLGDAQMDALNMIWHRLDPWPEAVRGVERLAGRYTVSTLSNGHVALLANMAKRAGLRWDVVLSAELFRQYKPDEAVYTGAAALLGLSPGEVMMVAAHADDLEAARGAGLRTAYVHRPLEHGAGRVAHVPTGAGFDVYAADFGELASKLGVPL
jgi:2-haloacid dehalogenase